MPTYRSITYETEPIEDYAKKPPRYASQPPCCDEDIYSRETVSRRKDQRIKDDINNKLYRIEMDRIKPSFNVQLQTGFRKTTTLPKRRHYSPETRAEPVIISSNTDRRRYSMAGGLNLYRAPTQYVEDYTFNRPDPVSDSELKSAMVLFDSGRHKNGPIPTYSSYRTYDSSSSRPGLDYVDEYTLRKQAASKVRGRSVGPVVTTTTTYAPITTYVPPAPRPRTISTPPEYYRPLQTNHQRTEVSTGRKLSDSQHELDEFERLMRKTFGHGGVNRNSTLLYASPLVPRTYSYGSLPTYGYAPYGSYSYGLPSYTGSYPYVPASRYSSYYSGPTYYGGNVTTYPTYSYPSYSYVEQRPVEYDYPLYSPPTRVTGPSEYSTYYDRGLYGGRSTRLPYTTTNTYNY